MTSYAWTQVEQDALTPGTPIVLLGPQGRDRIVLFAGLHGNEGVDFIDVMGEGATWFTKWECLRPFNGPKALPLDEQFHEKLQRTAVELATTQRQLYDLKIEWLPLRQALSLALNETLVLAKRVAELEAIRTPLDLLSTRVQDEEPKAVVASRLSFEKMNARNADLANRWLLISEKLGVEGGLPNALERCLQVVDAYRKARDVVSIGHSPARVKELGAELRRTVQEAAENPSRPPEQSGNANLAIALLARFADLFGGE